MYLYVKWNSFGLRACPPTFPTLEHGLFALATPVAKTCDAGGGALRPKWREWPARALTRVLLANLIRDTVFTSGVSNAAEQRL